MYEDMPSKFRMNAKAKPFKFTGNVKRAMSRAGLTKTEKKETRVIAKKVLQARKETKFCPQVFTYDDFANPTAFDLPEIGRASCRERV